MHRRVLVLIAITLIASRCYGEDDSKIFLSNGRGLDYKFQGKKDEHRFGVEVEENRQFHHTVTDADGVRLGCYGYELYGQKYSTNYIADGKGYRLAPKSDVIIVYSKDTQEPRKASFIGSFSGEVQSQNIRYLFPEGCEAPKIQIDPIKRAENRKKFIESLQEDALRNQRERNIQVPRSRNSKKFNEINNLNQFSTTVTEASSSSTTTTTSPTSTEEATATTTTETTTPQQIVVTTESFFATDDLAPSIDALKSRDNRNPNSLLTEHGKKDEEKYQADSPVIEKSTDQCCDTQRVKIILPSNDEDSCSANRMAKISIPISAEKLSKIPMKDLLNLSSTRSTLNMLQNLISLVEKYEL